MPEPAAFELEQFGWRAPDRLELSGRFSGLADVPLADPTLILRSGDETYRLPVVLDSHTGPPVDGDPWRAAFAWHDAPVSFDAAELALGGDVVIALPQPRELAAGGADHVRLHADLVVAQQEVHELRATAQQAAADLTRAREDLDAERERRSADAERFRAGLAAVRGSAEEALAAEHGAVAQLESELREARAALETGDAAQRRLQIELNEALAERLQAREEAVQAQRATEAAQAELQRLRGRLASIREALDGSD